MTKRIIALLFAIIICTMAVTPAFADEIGDIRVNDFAGLLNDSEFLEVQDKLNEVSKSTNMDVIVVTTNSLEGMDTQDYSELCYDSFGYTGDCVILLVSMEYRDVDVTSLGENAMNIFSTDECSRIREDITEYLTDGRYCDAFIEYADLVDNTVYDATHFDIFFNLLIAIGVGLVIALIVVLIMKSQLKSVRYQSAASNYMKPGSMEVTAAHEHFLYRNVTRVKIEKNSSSGGSGSSNSSSGKF